MQPNSQRSQPRSAEVIASRHYVVDYLDSFDSEYAACQVVEEVKLVHQLGSSIRNWFSNSATVLQWVGKTDAGTMKIVSDGGSEI